MPERGLVRMRSAGGRLRDHFLSQRRQVPEIRDQVVRAEARAEPEIDQQQAGQRAGCAKQIEAPVRIGQRGGERPLPLLKQRDQASRDERQGSEKKVKGLHGIQPILLHQRHARHGTGAGLPLGQGVGAGADERGVELVWFENPGWQRHVIATGLTQPINVDAYDERGNGEYTLVLGTRFAMEPSRSVGIVSVLIASVFLVVFFAYSHAADALFNQVAKIRHIFGGDFAVPLVIRVRVSPFSATGGA